jgi:ABC-2 type transport system ATP-binding protein
MVAIETNELTKEYGDLTALDGLNLTVEDGEVFGFLGPNGAGKTTTIDLLLDFIRPTSGSATVLGYDAQTEADQIRDRIGILPDGFDLWERSSGYRHLEFAIKSKGAGERPDELLGRVGLEPADAKRKVGDYSKGMLQRLAMAISLVGDPELLIFDEPSTGLDPNGIRTMQQLVREEANSGTTVFFSSHILSQVSGTCDRVGILDDGELITIDTIDGLRESAGIGSTLVLELDEPVTESFDAIEGVTDVTTNDRELTITYTDDRAKASTIHQVIESGVSVLDFRVEEPGLDELFAAFTDPTRAQNGVTAEDGNSQSKQSAVATDGSL